MEREDRLLTIALANDDEFPDDVCPGCGGDISNFIRRGQYHYRRPDGEVRYTDMLGGDATTPWCPWDKTYLHSRVLRRRYIAEHAR